MKTRFPSDRIALAAAPMPKARIALVAEPIPSGRIAPAAMLLVAALLIAALLLAGCTFGELPGIKQQPSCGNLECEGGETAENCPQDCADCTDNDNGINFFVTGFAQDNVGGSTVDWCAPSTGTIKEGFCHKNQARAAMFQCPAGCSAGSCFCPGVSVAFRTSAVGGNYADGGWIALDRDGDGTLEGYGFQISPVTLIYNPAENQVLAKTPEGYYVISHSPIGASTQTVSILYTAEAPVGGATYSAAIYSNLDADAAGADLQGVPIYFYAYSDMEVCFDGTEYFSCADIPCAQQQYCGQVDPVNPNVPSNNAAVEVGQMACSLEAGNEELHECALVGGEPQLQMVEDCAACGGTCANGVCIGAHCKDSAKYSAKEVFLISDNDWQGVLELMPMAIWDDAAGQQHKYPALIYHSEPGVVLQAVAFEIEADGVPLSSKITTNLSYSPPTLSGVGDASTLTFELINGPGMEAYIGTLQVKGYPDYITCADNCTADVNMLLNPGETFQQDFLLTLTSLPLPSFDADSIIHFLQQYGPGRVTLVGGYPEQLYGLLRAAPPLGAGIDPSNLQEIPADKILQYWKNFDTVVYVDDDYGNALLASTYASLKNAPLVIKGSQFDTEAVMGGKNALCLGPSGWSQPAYVQCTEFYTAEQLQEHYVALTNTDKVLFVNPNDINLEFSISDSITPEKSQTPIGELYTKNSLSAPYLAAARYEVLVSNLAYAPEPDKNVVRDDLHAAINRLLPDLLTRPGGITSVGGEYINGYLTIMAAHRAVPANAGLACYPGNPTPYVCTHHGYNPLDQVLYSDINGNDSWPDMFTGRISGLTASDVSAYVARDIFYNEMGKTDSVVFMASSADTNGFIENAIHWIPIFQNSGYQADLDTNPISFYDFDPTLWEGRDLVVYLDHGTGTWSGIYYDEIPELSNSVVLSHSCLTCTSQGITSTSFCMNALRRGALIYIGAVGVGQGANQIYMNTLNSIYYEDLIPGRAFTKHVSTWMPSAYAEPVMYRTTFIGDPALDIDPKYMLSQPLEWFGALTTI